MKTSDKPEFVRALDALAALFSREMDEPAIMLYWSAVSGLTIEQFKQAVGLAAQKCERFPPPATLLAMVDTEKTTKLKAAEAWPEVMKLARRSSSKHSDPIAAEAIKLMGGGKRLGQMPTDDLEVWGRKQFEELYEEVASSDRKQVEALPPGILPNLMGMPNG